jgi:hypothetical protein
MNRPSALGPKKGNRTIAPKKASLIKQQKMNKVWTDASITQTIRVLRLVSLSGTGLHPFGLVVQVEGHVLTQLACRNYRLDLWRRQSGVLRRELDILRCWLEERKIRRRLVGRKRREESKVLSLDGKNMFCGISGRLYIAMGMFDALGWW